MASSQWKDFDAVFYFDLAYSYDAASIEQITQCRAKLERQLFVDRLMKLLNISRRERISSRFQFILILTISSNEAISSEDE